MTQVDTLLLEPPTDWQALAERTNGLILCRLVSVKWKAPILSLGLQTGVIWETSYEVVDESKMARNEDRKFPSSSAFRKIDVDQYNENNFKEEDADGGSSGPTGPDENEVFTLLNQGKNAEALIYVLKSAPLCCKSQQVKDSARNLTLKVLLSIKSNQMDQCLVQLDRDLIDILMKYIYRGFEIPTEGSSGHLLIWHEKVYNISGVGSIVRVFSDSKRA